MGWLVLLLAWMVWAASVYLVETFLRCRVPDDWLLHNRRGLLMGREVLRAVIRSALDRLLRRRGHSRLPAPQVPARCRPPAWRWRW
jgi:hypothetical protein